MLRSVIPALALLMCTGAGGFEADELARLRAEAACAGCNLSAARLSDAALRGVDLTGADLRGADLTGARLTAFMPRVLLAGAKLDGADLSGAFLPGVEGLSQDQLDQACGDDGTTLPEGLEIKPCRAANDQQ